VQHDFAFLVCHSSFVPLGVLFMYDEMLERDSARALAFGFGG
jgi:hypothetical protein